SGRSSRSSGPSHQPAVYAYYILQIYLQVIVALVILTCSSLTFCIRAIS
ncbi:hypothetical protein LEMLEM_LOCUS10346, partial [Lemmus lemmus]